MKQEDLQLGKDLGIFDDDLTLPADGGSLASVGSSPPQQAAHQGPSEGSGTDVHAARPAGDGTPPEPLEGSFLWGRVEIDLLAENKLPMCALRVYAALSSFQGGDSVCNPPLKRITERAGVARSQVQKGIAWLEEHGWLTVDHSFHGNKYHVHDHPITTHSGNTSRGGNTTLTGNGITMGSGKPITTLGGNKKNIEKNIEKREYAPDVFLTEAEHRRLVDDYGETVIQSEMEDLSNYLGNRVPKNKYKDHNKTLRNWIKRDGHKKINNVGKVCPDCGAHLDGLGTYCDKCAWMADRDG